MKLHKHNLSHYQLATFDMGQLVPVGLVECLPGDVIDHHTNSLIRLSPLAAPVMHNITVRLHHWFVPHRIVWDGWEDFITGGPDGNNTDTVPQLVVNFIDDQTNRLWDYFGVAAPLEGSITLNALPINAFNLIYNEWYRDQDLCAVRNSTDTTIPFVAWEKDYFTTARPWTQKGPDVTVPLATFAPVVTANEGGYNNSAISVDANRNLFADVNTSNVNRRVYTDLSQANATNVNDWRRAFALQRYQEARARYGSRYTEYLRYLGVRPRDERLQRPEFLGGGTAQVQVSEVMQTAPETGQSPSNQFGVGDMYGHGVAALRSNRYRRMMEEHGYVITLASIRPKTIYHKALDRTWLRTDKEDFFQKELQHIGQQEIYNAEVQFQNNTDKTAVFGYQDRYAEYRQGFSKVTGEFRTLLNYWHLAREFATMPTLNQSFIDCEPSKRIHNEQTKNTLWCAFQHKIMAKRLVDRSAYAKLY